MRHYLGKLLEELDKEYPNAITLNELRQIISHDVDDTILEAMKRDLICYPTYKPNSIQGTIGLYDKYILSSGGFEILNQIKIKETIEQLDLSIKKFNESSDRTSKLLNKYTLLLIILTIFLACLTIISVLTPWLEKEYGVNSLFVIGFLIFVSFVTIFAVFYKKLKEAS